MESTTKKCRRCGEEKSVTEFGKSVSMADGLNPVCKNCINTAQRANHAKKKGDTPHERVESTVTKEVVIEAVEVPSNLKDEVELLQEFKPASLILALKMKGYGGDLWIEERIIRKVKL